mgnify:FL=1
MLENRSFVILGASGGIGSELARRLRADNAQVAIAGRNRPKLAELGNELDAPYFEVDATCVEDVETSVAGAADAMGGVDGIVNCVGSILLKPAHLTSPDEWRDTLAVNLTSAFATVRAGAKALRDEGGSIVLLSSAAARIGLPNHEAIAAAKAGVAGLTLSAAASYASRGIRVNAIAPGLVQTSMTERMWANPKSAETSRAMHAAGRLGEPRDVASLICWLLQPENDWVTGQIFGVDGGLGTLRVASRTT